MAQPVVLQLQELATESATLRTYCGKRPAAWQESPAHLNPGGHGIERCPPSAGARYTRIPDSQFTQHWQAFFALQRLAAITAMLGNAIVNMLRAD
jgi:hypothetical protein